MTAAVLRMSDARASTMIQGREVPIYTGRLVSDEDLQNVLRSLVFTNWIMGLDPRYTLTSIDISMVSYLTREPSERVRFVQMIVESKDTFPTAGTLRGPTVCILPVLVCRRRKHTIIVRQQRPIVGQWLMPEIIAGMTDGAHIVSKALDELYEETGGKNGGILIREDDLVSLGDYLQPSPGILDERMFFYCAHIDVEWDRLRSFENRMTGVEREGEKIILKVTPLHHLLTHAPHDMKAEVILTRYLRKFPEKRHWWRAA